eukprot:PhM_4_TR5335/c0_g1_i1/m.46195
MFQKSDKNSRSSSASSYTTTTKNSAHIDRSGGGGGAYAWHRLWLTFNDRETEERFFRYSYVESPFYGAKVLTFALMQAIITEYLTYRDDRYQPKDLWSLFVMLVLVCVFGLYFVDRCKPYREMLYTLMYAVYCPHMIDTQSFHKSFVRYGNGFIFAFNFTAAITPGVRFCRLVWLVPLVTFTTHIVASCLIEDYWATYEWMQALFWLGNVIPVLVLYHVEV